MKKSVWYAMLATRMEIRQAKSSINKLTPRDLSLFNNASIVITANPMTLPVTKISPEESNWDKFKGVFDKAIGL